MEKLALFDIDYTITKKETLMEFYKYIVSRDIKNIKFLHWFMKFIVDTTIIKYKIYYVRWKIDKFYLYIYE